MTPSNKRVSSNQPLKDMNWGFSGKRVGRATKLLSPEVVQGEVDARSIAANPFPYNITMDEVEAFFKQHGEVLSSTSIWCFDLCKSTFYFSLLTG